MWVTTLVTARWQIPGLAVLAVVLAGVPAGEPAAERNSGGSARSGAAHSHSGKSHSGRHHHRRSGSNAGFGAFWGPAYWLWWNYPLYYLQADMPIEYIERNEQETPAADHWLYCAQTQSYYPHVGECPAGWERVPAAPLK